MFVTLVIIPCNRLIILVKCRVKCNSLVKYLVNCVISVLKFLLYPTEGCLSARTQKPHYNLDFLFNYQRLVHYFMKKPKVWVITIIIFGL